MPDFYTGPYGRIRQLGALTRQMSNGAYVSRRGEAVNIAFGYFGGGGYAFGLPETANLRILPVTYQDYTQIMTAGQVLTVVYSNGAHINLTVGVDIPLHSQLRVTDWAYFRHDWDSAHFYSVQGNERPYRQLPEVQRQAYAQVQAALADRLQPPRPPSDALFFSNIHEYGRQSTVYAAELGYYLSASVLFPLLASSKFTESDFIELESRVKQIRGRLLRRSSLTLEDVGQLPPEVRAWAERWSTYVSEYAVDYASYDLGSTVGYELGSALGRAIGGSNPMIQTLSTSVLGTITQNIGQAIAVGGFDRPVLLRDSTGSVRYVADNVLDDAGAEFLANVRNAAIGTISSMLSMELGNALGLEGFGAELFNTAGSTVFSGVVNNVLNYGAHNAFVGFRVGELLNPRIPLFDAAGMPINGADGQQLTRFGGGFALAGAIGSFLGGRLGSLVVSPQTQAGAVLSSLGSSVGAWAAISTSLSGAISAGLGLSPLSLAFNFIAPGIGAFVGFVLGALIGNLFGRKKPRVPTANAEVYLNYTTDQFAVGGSSQSNGGSLELVRQMATTARDTLNGLLTVLAGDMPYEVSSWGSGLWRNGSCIAADAGVQTFYGHTGGQLWIRTGGPNAAQQNVSSADEAVSKGVMWSLNATQITGGDIFAKRALARSQVQDLSLLMGNLQIADDYRRYMEDYRSINALISRNPSSSFAATWAITLIAAEELKLDQWAPSDFHGGMQGFLTSLGIEGYGAHFEDVTVSNILGGMTLSVDSATAQDGVFGMLPQALASANDDTWIACIAA